VSDIRAGCDADICGDDGPISPEECAQWLDAKFKRHGEAEDRAAAQWLRKLSTRLDRVTQLETRIVDLYRALVDGGSDEWFAAYLIQAITADALTTAAVRQRKKGGTDPK
jgi:hypothetical protein